LQELQRIAKDYPGSYGQAGSTTLQEVGWINYLKANPTTFAENTRELAAAAMGKGDWGVSAKYNKAGCNADLFCTSVCAVTHKGEMISCDLTGTRVSGLPHTAGKVVVVIGANKIVPTLQDAERRMNEYCLPWESARSRIAYAAMGVKASKINNVVVVNGANPFGAPKRIHVIIVNERLGF